MENPEIGIVELFVDYLMPDLSPHESSMYLFLYRLSFLKTGEPFVRIGQRTIASKYGRGPKMSVPSRAHINKQLKSLEEKGCLSIGDQNRDGTLYRLTALEEIPSVRERMELPPETDEGDYYNDLTKRGEIYERDGWKCRYCGEPLDEKNVTLDHFIPQHLAIDHSAENLRTACLTCNSIKSGKSFEDVAVALLESVAKRRSKTS